MTKQRMYQWTGVLSLFVAAMAAHWLISPMQHPDASRLRTVAVYLQLFGGAICAFFSWRASKQAAA